MIFKDDNSQEVFLDQLSASYLDLMKRPLQLIRLKLSESLRSHIEFLKWPGDEQ